MPNNPNTLDIAIIGAGLSGLYLAHQLVEQRGETWARQQLGIFEARERCGGRILGLQAEQQNSYHWDMGPSWLWPNEQPLMAELVARLELPLLKQWQQGIALFQAHREHPAQRYIDEQTYTNACRISGGSQRLIDALIERLPESIIHSGQQLQQLTDEGGQIRLQFSSAGTQANKRLSAKQVILALPPRIVAAQMDFSPTPPKTLLRLMQSTPTWMAGQAKVVIHYKKAFWRQQGFSGAAMANFTGAPLGEIFDACGPKAEPAALGAFMALPVAMRQHWREDLPALILDQMTHLFGQEAATPLQLEIQDWATEPCTATPADAEPLYEHPQYGHQWFELDHWNDKLFFSGTETSTFAGGYMEGALQSAARVHKALSLSTFASKTED